MNRAAVAAAAALLLSLPTPGSPLDGATDGSGDVAARSAGLQWRFVRIKYHYDPAALRAMQLDVYGEPWGIDSPAAEQNLSRRVKTATSIAVEDPILMTLDDPQLFQHP